LGFWNTVSLAKKGAFVIAWYLSLDAFTEIGKYREGKFYVVRRRLTSVLNQRVVRVISREGRLCLMRQVEVID